MLSLIILLSFLIPTQLALHINNLSTTVYGFKIDYLTPTIYLTDLVVILILIFGILKVKFTKKYYILSIVYFGYAFINLNNTLFIIPAIYKWFKLTEMILLGLVIINTKKFEIFKEIDDPVFLISAAITAYKDRQSKDVRRLNVASTWRRVGRKLQLRT